MTVLELIQDFCQTTGLAVPALVVGSTDPQVIQLLGLLRRSGRALSNRGTWEGLVSEASWTTTATEDQGALATLAPGYRWLKPETLWDRTEKLPLLGPTSGWQWQYLKAIVVAGPRYSFRIRQGRFIVTPAPPAGHTWAFEYISDRWLLDDDGTIRKNAPSEDADTILLPEACVLADLAWRWRREKGLSYTEEFNDAERLIVDTLGRSTGLAVLAMDRRSYEAQPKIVVQPYSWPL